MDGNDYLWMCDRVFSPTRRIGRVYRGLFDCVGVSETGNTIVTIPEFSSMFVYDVSRNAGDRFSVMGIQSILSVCDSNKTAVCRRLMGWVSGIAFVSIEDGSSMTAPSQYRLGYTTVTKDGRIVLKWEDNDVFWYRLFDGKMDRAPFSGSVRVINVVTNHDGSITVVADSNGDARVIGMIGGNGISSVSRVRHLGVKYSSSIVLSDNGRTMAVVRTDGIDIYRIGIDR